MESENLAESERIAYVARKPRRVVHENPVEGSGLGLGCVDERLECISSSECGACDRLVEADIVLKNGPALLARELFAFANLILDGGVSLEGGTEAGAHSASHDWSPLCVEFADFRSTSARINA